MTKVEAIIRPSKVEEVTRALSAWVEGLTLVEVKGHGRQKGHLELHRGAEYTVDFVPKVKLEVIVPTPLVPRILDLLERTVRTGKIGDGKVFASPVDEAVRVRTGERGEEAL